MIEVLQHYASDLLYKSGEHLYISMLGLLLAILVAVPIGILITRVPKIANVVVGLASVLQTVPSLALRHHDSFYGCWKTAGYHGDVYILIIADPALSISVSRVSIPT